MKISKNIEAIIITLLYLTCLYFWTLPIQKNPVPYGEVDATSHYAVADYTYQTDSSITTLPYYIEIRYGKDNKFKPHTLWYPPPFHTSLAIAAVFGNQTDIPIYILNAIFCSLIVLSVYFIMRKFFGFIPALLSSFLLIFSIRDIMIYLWGQWPERMGFAYLPLILYCFYKYCNSHIKKEEKPIYIYIMSLLLAINFFIHPMDFFHSVAALIIVTLFFLIKEKRLFFSIKHIFTAIILFLLVISIFPSQSMNVILRLQSDKGDAADAGDISRLFYWFKPQKDNPGVPQSYFSYKEMLGPYWTIPLILLGILFLLLRRNRKDLVMLAWLVSLYIMLHLDFIGKGRVHRSLSGTAHIFYPLMVLGMIYLISFIPKLRGYKSIIKYGLIIVFTVFMFISIGTEANSSLKGAYPGISRLNPYQYELTDWLKNNIPEDENTYHMGSISTSKTRWLWMISNRHLRPSSDEDINSAYNITHVIIDYSDFALIGDQNTLNKIQEWEKQNMANNSLIYDKTYIKVYKVEN
jgi:hypothetical protein